MKVTLQALIIDSGTGSQPNNSKPPMVGTTASPVVTTSGSGMVGSTAGSGSVSTAGKVTNFVEYTTSIKRIKGKDK